MARESLVEVRLSSHVAHQDRLVLAAARDEAARPGARTHPQIVTAHDSYATLLRDIPNLDLPIVGPNAQMCTLL